MNASWARSSTLSRRAALNKMSGCAARNDLQMIGTFASVFIPMNVTMLSARSICPHKMRKGGLQAGVRARLDEARLDLADEPACCIVVTASSWSDVCVL